MEKTDVIGADMIYCPITSEALGAAGKLSPVLVRSCGSCGNRIKIDFTEELKAMADYHHGLSQEQTQRYLSVMYKTSHNTHCVECQKYEKQHTTDYNRAEFVRRAVAAGIPESCVFSDKAIENGVLMREIRNNINTGLYIWGDNRIGKSRAVCAIGAKLAQTRRVFYRSAEELAMEYRSLFKDNDDSNESEWTNRITQGHSLVIIDDIGQTTISSGFGGKLWYIADKAIVNGFSLWVVSNLGLPDLQDIFYKNGAAGRSIRTRIEESCRIWNPNGGFFVNTSKYKPRVKK